MRVSRQPAYILHTRAWRESSLLLEAFTRDFGRIGLVARGVRRPRARLSRSLLEPIQALRLEWTGRGELGTLTAVDPDAAAHALRGDALLSAMYVNELLVRLVARDDPHPELFAHYRALLDELADAPSIGWRLRCFERDLLVSIGYAPRLESDASGAPVDAARVYDYLPEAGAVDAGDRSGGMRLRGSALLALAHGAPPDAADQASLRRLMRMLIRVHAGGRELQSWRVLADSAKGR